MIVWQQCLIDNLLNSIMTKELKLYKQYNNRGETIKQATFPELKKEGYFESKEICCIWKKQSRTKIAINEKESNQWRFEYYINSSNGYRYKITPVHFKNLELLDTTTDKTKERIGQKLLDQMQFNKKTDLMSKFRLVQDFQEKSFNLFAFYQLTN